MLRAIEDSVSGSFLCASMSRHRYRCFGSPRSPSASILRIRGCFPGAKLPDSLAIAEIGVLDARDLISGVVGIVRLVLRLFFRPVLSRSLQLVFAPHSQKAQRHKRGDWGF